MYLKALEIQGFKSFPDKVRLPFEQKVIAIVGPNGSGKSNISDAICWVMGEQRSKALRGEKMEDVIFGGTAARGPSGFAQVSLVLGNEDRSLNCDADEVSITRRFYRSGESEYFINKQSVRLKDVSELLMDTGLGRDGYSLVGQGRVDEILAAKSTDRREIFEEAAGISKFRHKKDETERKLEKTGENLLRVGDKIAELELQVEPLRRQAETAKKYLLLRDELRGLEISLWLDSLDKLTEKSRELMREYDECAEQLSGEKEKLEGLYRESEECSEAIRAADEQAEELRTAIAAQESEAASVEAESAALSAEMQNNLGSIQRLKEEQTRQNQRETELREKLETQRKHLVELADALRELHSQRDSLLGDSSQAAVEVDEASAKLDALMRRAADEERAAAAEQARLEALRASLEGLQPRMEAAAEEQKNLRGRLETETGALEAAKQSLVQQREKAAEAQDRCRSLEFQAKALRQKAETVSESLRKAKMEEGAIQSRVSLLSDMEREYEGFSRAIRVVMREKERGNLQNIHGTVAELIHTEDRYTVAIETALGAGLQNVVVDREEDGKAAINLLKRMDAGRATFLPLSTIRGSELREPGLNELSGVEGIASQLVRFDEAYRDVILFELGRTVVARDMDAAIAVSRKFGGRLRIVTLDGQLINAGGSMTGGSSAKNVGVLSRANELTRLREKLNALRMDGERLQKERSDSEKALADMLREADAAAAALRSAEDTCLSLQSELRQREALTEALRKSVEAAESAAANAEKEAEALREAEKNALSAAEQHRKTAETLRQQTENSSQDTASLRARLDELTTRRGRMQTEEAALETEISSVTRSVSEWKALLDSYRVDRESRESLSSSLRDKNAELDARLQSQKARSAQHRAEAEKLRPRLSETMLRRQEQEARRTRADKSAQELNKRINELERQFAALEQRKATADMEEKQLLDKLWDNYELTRSAAQRQRIQLDSVPKAQKRAGSIRREMSGMGTPNLGAIEEYERVNERYTFLTTQRDDIVKARDELKGVIAELTKEMERIFRTEFDSVAVSFSQTFTELFGGGKGELLLENENDILNCGIEIRVQPPGKALKALSLLSGGERAFVAIALYFAMLKVRPAPFCVMDEIESALDENNVSRFAQYTRKMSEHTQFLIITHRRGSMEEADVLFGVTMQKGVSKVLSVELSEALRANNTV